MDGAIGAGLVLVFLPCVALYFGVDKISASPGIGLPILAIFGIMILFGALALVSTLFQRLGLSDPKEALALPNGSIRATIALALIVLFAIIAIMLYQSLATPDRIGSVTKEQAIAMLSEPTSHVVAVTPDCAQADCAYSVYVKVPPSLAATDLAKQLLILIGTLMTSVTSFYFAARTVEKARDAAATSLDTTRGSLTAGDPDAESALDGCNVPITNATPDDDLPAAHGGVSPV
jgi:hypothetical protein